jgi:hypothetical protein
MPGARNIVMRNAMEPREILAITNANKGWVVSELDRLRQEWAAWLETAKNLPDSPDYNPCYQLRG